MRHNATSTSMSCAARIKRSTTQSPHITCNHNNNKRVATDLCYQILRSHNISIHDFARYRPLLWCRRRESTGNSFDRMGDIRAGLEDLKLDSALFANVKYYVSGAGDPKVCYNFRSFPAFLFRRCSNTRRMEQPWDSLLSQLTARYLWKLCCSFFRYETDVLRLSTKVIIWNTISH